jgi:hypothetical protein
VTYPVGDQAVLQVWGNAAAVTIRTWDRDEVQVDDDDDSAFYRSRATVKTSASFPIPAVSEQRPIPGGTRIETLATEDFPVPKLAPRVHDAVRIRAAEPRPDPGQRPPLPRLTIMIPESTGLVYVRLGHGSLTLRDYRGTSIVSLNHGRITFADVGGDAFVQPLNARFYATRSAFDRLRARSSSGDEIFDACRVREIEATTISGTILFDNGVFDPGLALFASSSGSIAVGVNGGAQIGAHTDDGRIWSMLHSLPPSPVMAASPSDDGLQVAGDGGPLVNASTEHGNVFLYDGSLSGRPRSGLGEGWHPMLELLQAARPRRRAP